MEGNYSNSLEEAMKKISVRISVSTFVLLMSGMLFSGIAVARATKVDICHVTGNGTYHLISVSENAVPAHLAHGDAFPGDPVPGLDGKIFADDCSFEGGPPPPPSSGYEIVTSPAMSFGDGGYGGWSCPEGKIVTGGGFEATGPVSVSAPGMPGSVWPHYTFGDTEYGWVVQDAPDGSGNTIMIYAICTNP